MIWVLLYIYVIGTLNDFMYAVNAEADLTDWKMHLNIAAWPITVPAAILVSIFSKEED
jgi:hypothetical protein